MIKGKFAGEPGAGGAFKASDARTTLLHFKPRIYLNTSFPEESHPSTIDSQLAPVAIAAHSV